jgi:putative ABC transport system substrate-binding protein
MHSSSKQLAALAVRHAVPSIYGRPADGNRLTGVYVDRILKGERPGEWPVQQATKVELFINLKTAKMLGLTVLLPLLGRADEVIDRRVAQPPLLLPRPLARVLV